ncbi:structural protein [Lactobacillus phage SAC12B]|uniref:Structural protein n=1 Tax=Lactobacillus phage SAC12B TaxID=2510941 RepID=A0A4Y5FFN1_9CAUD|nr:host range and adsorption protein [Lactobacillus phage SAC12B]QBJ03896.1 structural protein [Lactobacillus phage SAC12B]
MSTINGRACVVDGMPVDKVMSNGRLVYGRNLIKGSYDSSWGGITGNSGGTIQKVTMDSGEVALHVIGTNNSSGFYSFFNFPTSGNYVISVDVKGTGKVDRLGWENWAEPDQLAGMNPTSDWQRVSRTISFNGNAYAFDLYGTMDVYVRFFKLEKGTIATPWTPAPEDVLK